MKITNIIEETKSISSNIKNAYIDFSKMTISVVAVCSNVIRNGKPLIGYGFNSNGRYGQGHLIRERFVPRLLETNTNEILNDEGTNFDPTKIWNVMMKNEKPGGHGERSVAVGTIDMALWDLIAKIEKKPLFQLISEKFGNGNPNRKVFVYAAGGYYWPDQGLESLKDEIKSYLDRGYNVVKKKIGAGNKGYFVARSKKDIYKSIKKKNFIIQEYLSSSKEFTACIYSNGNKDSNILIFERVLDKDKTIFARLYNNKKVNKQLERILKVIDFSGSINIQFKIINKMIFWNNFM